MGVFFLSIMGTFILGDKGIENGKLIENRAYYVAHTNIVTFALLDETKGSNWLQCRRR